MNIEEWDNLWPKGDIYLEVEAVHTSEIEGNIGYVGYVLVDGDSGPISKVGGRKYGRTQPYKTRLEALKNVGEAIKYALREKGNEDEK